MKLLLDHCVHRGPSRALPTHDVKTAAELHWDALKNGQLLVAAASAGFDAIITVDKNFRHQQNLAALPLTVIELDVPDTRLPSLVSIAPRVDESLRQVSRFRFISVHADGRIETINERS